MEATSLGLRSLPDGSYVYVGTAGERFDALIREDGTVLYPVREGIPVLLVEEGIVLEPPAKS